MLAISVWAAARNALSYIKPGAELDLKSPATGEEILRVLTGLQMDSKPAHSSEIAIPRR